MKKLFAFIIFTMVIAAITILFVNFFITEPTGVSFSFRNLFNVSLVIAFMMMALYGLSRIKALLEPHVGIQAATILQYVSVAITVTVASFIILGFFNVSPRRSSQAQES